MHHDNCVSVIFSYAFHKTRVKEVVSYADLNRFGPKFQMFVASVRLNFFFQANNNSMTNCGFFLCLWSLSNIKHY